MSLETLNATIEQLNAIGNLPKITAVKNMTAMNRDRVGNVAALARIRDPFTLLSFPVKGQADRWHFADFAAAIKAGENLIKLNAKSRHPKPLNLHITDNGLRMTVVRYSSATN